MTFTADLERPPEQRSHLVDGPSVEVIAVSTPVDPLEDGETRCSRLLQDALRSDDDRVIRERDHGTTCRLEQTRNPGKNRVWVDNMFQDFCTHDRVESPRGQIQVSQLALVELDPETGEPCARLLEHRPRDVDPDEVALREPLQDVTAAAADFE